MSLISMGPSSISHLGPSEPSTFLNTPLAHESAGPFYPQTKFNSGSVHQSPYMGIPCILTPTALPVRHYLAACAASAAARDLAAVLALLSRSTCLALARTRTYSYHQLLNNYHHMQRDVPVERGHWWKAQ